MSFAASVLRQQKAARVLSPRGVAFMQKSKNDSNSAASFWTTTPVQQAAPEKKAPKETVRTGDVVKAVATQHDLSQAESRRIMNTIFDTIIDSLKDKKGVTIAHFGTFETYLSKGRTARNPRTGESVLVPAKDRIRFRPHSLFKNTVTGEHK